MGIARRIAHTTYRHEPELDERFGRRPRAGEDPLGGGGRYDVESYLDHHAAKLARRFDPNSYVVLTEAMNSHDLGRDRGGVAAALRAFGGELHVAGVTTDRLYPLRLTEEIAALRPGTGSRSWSPATGTTASSWRPHRWGRSSTASSAQADAVALRYGQDVGHRCSVLRRRS